MNLEQLINKIKTQPDQLLFEETMSVIDSNYDFTESEFTNGNVLNKAGENSGSCKVLTFGQLNDLSKEHTLFCFGQYYRDVLADPKGDSHQNIRQFMINGWEGVSFTQQALK